MAKHRSPGEGSIFRRASGEWVAMLTLPDGRRKSFYGPTRREVKERLQQAQKDVDRGVPVLRGRPVTLGQFIENWLAGVRGRVRPRTHTRYENILRVHVLPSLGQTPLRQLTPTTVEALLSARQDAGASPRTAAHIRAVLRNALSKALRDGLVVRNAAGLADTPSVSEREVRALTPDDARSLLAAVEGDRLAALFTVALALGLRQSEALGLRWADVDLDRGTLTVQRTLQRVNGTYQSFPPKTPRSRRTLPLPAPVVAALRGHKGRQLEERLRVGPAWQGPTGGDLVFTDEAGAPLSGFHVSRRFKALLAAAGLPPMRYHDLRHGAASLMATQGVPARVAMETLGHSDISTTMNIYSHVAAQLQREAADRMAAALWD